VLNPFALKTGIIGRKANSLTIWANKDRQIKKKML